MMLEYSKICRSTNRYSLFSSLLYFPPSGPPSSTMSPLVKLTSSSPIHHHILCRSTTASNSPASTITPCKMVKLGFCRLYWCSKSGGDLSIVSAVEEEDSQWLENDCSPTSTYINNHVEQSREGAVKQTASTKLLTLPTILTIARVLAVPLLICNFYMDSWWGTTATTGIFIAAAITDWLDGYLARRMKLGSAFGAFLDPVADKLMVAATLVLLCTRPPEVAIFGLFPWLLTVPSIATIGREITMSAVREWAASQNSNLSEAVAVNNLGKWKTAAQMTSLTILLITRDSSFAGPGVFVKFGVALLYISAWLAVWSLVVYMKKIWKVLLM